MIPGKTFSEYLLIERSRALAGNRNISLLSEFGVICASIFILSRSADWLPVLAWAFCVQTASLYSWYSHKDAGNHKTEAEGEKRLTKIVFATWLVATVWGSVPLFFLQPGDHAMLIILICLYAGYVSGALAVSLAYTRSFIAFAIGISLPFAARLVIEGGELYWLIVILMMFYIAMLSYVSLNLQKLFIENTRSSYDNLQLIEQLVHEKNTAERATQAKSEFLASASHDLRQPIHAANLFLDILQPLQKEPRNQQILEKVRQSMQGLNKMLHGLLDISRLDAAVVENKPEHISLNRIIEQLIAEPQAISQQVSIENNLDREYFVYADPMVVERIVRNLLDNALKYTKQGSIRFSARQKGNSVILTLTDSGIGIPQDKLETIFDEFIQLHNPERDRQKGLGLGLAIVKRLCTLAGLEINVKSELGKGTRISLSFPTGRQREKPEIQVSDQSLYGLRVMVIDDEVDILEGMQALLEQWGCHVLTAENMEQAEQRADQLSFKPKVLIADFRLREEQSGIEVINTCKARYGPGLITILLTGDTAPERVQQASESGANVMYKPVDGATLKFTLQSLLLDSE